TDRVPSRGGVTPPAIPRARSRPLTSSLSSRAKHPSWARWIGSAGILAAVMVPWLLAMRLPGSPRSFWGGVWYSPDDSRLRSVVQEGMQGHWLHRPPYGAAPGPGAFFYPEYLLLGHL